MEQAAETRYCAQRACLLVGQRIGDDRREVAEKLALSPSAASRCVQEEKRVIASDGLVFKGFYNA